MKRCMAATVFMVAVAVTTVRAEEYVHRWWIAGFYGGSNPHVFANGGSLRLVGFDYNDVVWTGGNPVSDAAALAAVTNRPSWSDMTFSGGGWTVPGGGFRPTVRMWSSTLYDFVVQAPWPSSIYGHYGGYIFQAPQGGPYRVSGKLQFTCDANLSVPNRLRVVIGKWESNGAWTELAKIQQPSNNALVDLDAYPQLASFSLEAGQEMGFLIYNLEVNDIAGWKFGNGTPTLDDNVALDLLPIKGSLILIR